MKYEVLITVSVKHSFYSMGIKGLTVKNEGADATTTYPQLYICAFLSTFHILAIFGTSCLVLDNLICVVISYPVLSTLQIYLKNQMKTQPRIIYV